MHDAFDVGMGCTGTHSDVYTRSSSTHEPPDYEVCEVHQHMNRLIVKCVTQFKIYNIS